MEPFETFEHAGLTVELHYDDAGGDYCNPRDNDGNVVTIVNLSRNFDDVDDGPEIAEAIERWGWDDERKIRTYLYAFQDVLYADTWQHQGSSQSDWSHGWAYVTRQAMRDAGFSDPRPGVPNATDEITPEAAKRQFDAEVGEFTAWRAGEVYGFVIKDPETDEVVESCWGFIGDDRYDDAGNKGWGPGFMSYVEREARAVAETCAPVVAHDKEISAQEVHADYCRKVAKVASILMRYAEPDLDPETYTSFGQRRAHTAAETVLDALGIAPVVRPDLAAHSPGKGMALGLTARFGS